MLYWICCVCDLISFEEKNTHGKVAVCTMLRIDAHFQGRSILWDSRERNPSLSEYRHPTSSANTSVRRLEYPSSSEMQISAPEKTCEASAIKDRILSLERAPCPSLWVRSRQGRLPSDRPPRREIAKCLLAVERCRVADYRGSGGGGTGGGDEERGVRIREVSKEMQADFPSLFRLCSLQIPKLSNQSS